eukprot:6174660-Pleurochrysis_carterae.AAC.2
MTSHGLYGNCDGSTIKIVFGCHSCARVPPHRAAGGAVAEQGRLVLAPFHLDRCVSAVLARQQWCCRDTPIAILQRCGCLQPGMLMPVVNTLSYALPFRVCNVLGSQF